MFELKKTRCMLIDTAARSAGMTKKQLAFALWPTETRAQQLLNDIESGHQRLSMGDVIELIEEITRITGQPVVLDYLADQCGYTRGKSKEDAVAEKASVLLSEVTKTLAGLQHTVTCIAGAIADSTKN